MAGVERLSFDDPLAQLVADAHAKWNDGFVRQTGSGTAYEAIADALRSNRDVVLRAFGGEEGEDEDGRFYTVASYDDFCRGCGHHRISHIYEEGACRPAGVVCECKAFEFGIGE